MSDRNVLVLHLFMRSNRSNDVDDDLDFLIVNSKERSCGCRFELKYLVKINQNM